MYKAHDFITHRIVANAGVVPLSQSVTMGLVYNVLSRKVHRIKGVCLCIHIHGTL